MSIQNIASTISLNSTLKLSGSELSINTDIMRQYDIYITAEEIRNMSASPILLVPPPGVGMLIALWKIILYPKVGSPAVVFNDGSDVVCTYGNSGATNAEASSYIPANTFIQACFNNSQYQMNGTPSTDVTNLSYYEPYANQGIYLTNPGTAFTGGDDTLIFAKAWFHYFEIPI